MQVESLLPLVVPYAGVGTNLDRDINSYDRTTTCRLARRVGAALLIFGFGFLLFITLSAYVSSNSNLGEMLAICGALALSHFVPGIILRVAGRWAARGGGGASIAIFITGLWTITALGAILLVPLWSAAQGIHFLDRLSYFSTNEIDILILSLLDVLVVVGSVRLLYHCLMLLLFKGRRVSLGGAVRLSDLLSMSKRRLVPENALGAAALLGNIRLFEGLLLFLVGTACFVLSVDWIQMPAAATAPIATGVAPGWPVYSGDVFLAKFGLPAAERKAAIDAMCDYGLDPGARDLLDEALRWDGRSILNTLASPITAKSVAAAIDPAGAQSAHRAPLYDVEIPGMIRISYRPQAGNDRLELYFLNGWKYRNGSYTTRNLAGMSLRRINQQLDEINQARPGSVTPFQADAFALLLAGQMRWSGGVAAVDAPTVDQYESLPDGTLKISQSGKWLWIERGGHVATISPQTQAAMDLLDEKEAMEQGKIRIARWPAAILAVAGFFGFLTGVATFIRTRRSRASGHRFPARFYVAATILMTAGLVCVNWNWVIRTGSEHDFLASAKVLFAVAAIWLLWTLAIGILAPIRIAAIR